MDAMETCYCYSGGQPMTSQAICTLNTHQHMTSADTSPQRSLHAACQPGFRPVGCHLVPADLSVRPDPESSFFPVEAGCNCTFRGDGEATCRASSMQNIDSYQIVARPAGTVK